MKRLPAARWLHTLVLAGLAGIAQAQILIGQTAGFTGPVAAGVEETTAGARLLIDAVNAQGGIGGQKIELVSLDDKFSPKLAGENARQLVEQRGVLALFLTRGTPHTQAVLPHLQAHGVPLVGPSTGAMVLHAPANRHVFNVRATYQRESQKAIEHLHTIGLRRIAVAHADDSFGADVLEGAMKGFAQVRLAPAAVLKVDRDQPDIPALVRKLLAANVQSVLWIGSAQAVSDGVKALRAAGSSAQVVTVSNNASSGFIQALGPHARGVVVTQVYPSERSISYPFVKQAQELARERDVQLSPAMLEGYSAARVLVEGLRRVRGTPTREKLLAALEGISHLDLGGLELGYAPGDRSGLDFVDLSIIDGSGRFVR